MRRGSPLLPADSVDWSALIPSATTSRCWWKASDEWPGDFGFVTLAVRPVAFAGSDVWYVRTDASDPGFAEAEHLVHVPKLAPLTGEGLSGAAYVVEGGPDDQPTVFSTEPGRDDYLGDGQLLEPVDTTAMRATFKLGQCYPGSRYFVLDHSADAAAEMTQTVFSPRLQDGPSGAGATGRTNVFMNGLEGPGPMGFQPSAFDFAARDPAWSPYWDHWTYAWRDGVEPRLLESQTAIHDARDAGDLDEFPGTPDMGGLFTVNCPVPVLAPDTYRPPA